MHFIDVMDILGMIAFTISGVLVGIKNRFDLLGILFLALITASGGGMIRDVILSNEMPVFFTQSRYFITIFISTVITCLIAYFSFGIFQRISFLVQVFDAIGLGVFTIVATYRSILLNVPLIGVLFIAVLTGIGGGVIRDILVNDVPLVFRSEIYALASIIGAACFYFLYYHNVMDLNLMIYLCIFIIFAIRMLSIYFKLNLPVITIKYKWPES